MGLCNSESHFLHALGSIFRLPLISLASVCQSQDVVAVPTTSKAAECNLGVSPDVIILLSEVDVRQIYTLPLYFIQEVRTLYKCRDKGAGSVHSLN